MPIALLICTMSMAQNAMFIPFGLPLKKVQNSLQEKDYIKRVSYESEIIESKVNHRQVIRYHMKRDILFAIEDERIYLNKKEAERVIQTCVEYMGRGNRKAKVLSNKGGVTRWGMVETDRVLELVVSKKKITKKKFEYLVVLKATSRFHGPRGETEELASAIIDRMN
ncbi:MAG: hypothetical protein AAFY71_18470 [Bacteroidota bacterium]